MTTLLAPPRPDGVLTPAGPDAKEKWGDLISWSFRGNAGLRHRALVDALAKCGLDASAARELEPRNAWLRACRKLETDRIIRRLPRAGDQIKFQFNAVKESGETLFYPLETVVTLDAKTGKVECDDAALKVKAQALLDECIARRTGNDVTRVFQALFRKERLSGRASAMNDLFPALPQGTVYFASREHSALVDKVVACVRELGGTARRWPWYVGDPEADRAVGEVVASGIEGYIEEYEKAVEAWDEDTRDATIRRKVEQVVCTEAKIKAYAKHLGDQQNKLIDALHAAKERLKEKVLSLGKSVPA